MARVTTPWKRAWEGQRWLKMCESFQSAATGASAVITLARVSRPRPASRPMAVEASSITVLLVGTGARMRDPRLAAMLPVSVSVTPSLGRTVGFLRPREPDGYPDQVGSGLWRDRGRPARAWVVGVTNL